MLRGRYELCYIGSCKKSREAGFEPNTFSHTPIIVGRGYSPFHILNW